MAILLNKAQRVLNSEVAPEKKYRIIDMINVDQLNDFTVTAVNAFGTEEKLEDANKIGDVLVQMLYKRKLITQNAQQSFVDILLSAVLLHNLFYDAEDFTTLYKARKELASIAEDNEIPDQVQQALFQTIEAQLGEDMPVPTSRPIPNSPTELFAWAVWFVKEYEPQE
jgi:hypothetical protein